MEGLMENIELKKSNGETIKADLISYFKIVSKNKKYVFYTLNEVVENGLVKMYVAEVKEDNANLKVEAKMTDEEWAGLKSVMKMILTGNVSNDIEFLEIG